MKTIICTLLMLTISIITLAQTKDTSYYETPSAIVSYLKPITMEGGQFYYGNKPLSKRAGGFALEIPFIELDDAETNRHYKLFKGYNAASRWINVIPLAYIIYTANQRLYNTNEYWTVYLISTGGSIAFNLLERAQIKKAITRYNLRVERNKLGLSIQPLPHQSSALGIGFSRSF